jgi:hypothetical protein
VEETRPSIVHLMNNGNFIDNYEGDGNSKKFDTIVEDLQKKGPNERLWTCGNTFV